jgi:uncharacterized protein (DUF1015 family)
MALLKPFRALRPEPAVAHRVAAPPYDVVTTDEARALARGNPLSFLHVSRAEIDLPPGTPAYSDEVYAKAAENLARLRRQAPLVMEESPSLYVYRLQDGSHEQTGVAGCFSSDEYETETIRKHERTRRDKEDDRTRHILELRAQTGPVFLTYRASRLVDAQVAKVMGTRPMYDFTALDGVRHSVWRVEPPAAADLVTGFGAVPLLYIADGHHRAASAARARRQLRGATDGPGEWDTFLAVAFPDAQVQVLPYNRIVKNLGGQTPESFLDALRLRAGVADTGCRVPERPGEVCMFLAGRWYTLVLQGAPAESSPAARLDVSVLQDTVLAPVLDVRDVRSDPRIDFVGGSRGAAELERLVTSGVAAVAFSVFPVAVADVMTVTDAGGIMPPKSTWFEPKLSDGLLSHVI